MEQERKRKSMHDMENKCHAQKEAVAMAVAMRDGPANSSVAATGGGPSSLEQYEFHQWLEANKRLVDAGLGISDSLP